MVFEYIFWLMFFGCFYAYFGYLLLLKCMAYIYEPPKDPAPNYDLPFVSVLIPVHNEAAIIREKVANSLALDYESGKLELVFISDGSTDETTEILKAYSEKNIIVVEIRSRKGKANALNVGLEQAAGEIIVFSDSSIMLEKTAVRNLVAPFVDRRIGAISGEDHIREMGGEGLYGKYELYLRNLESKVGSIVGASGSFYAQRKELCDPFVEGVAPDFLSVLNTLEKGYRCVTEPGAVGFMTALQDHKDEYNRKIRTLVRGMAALFYKNNLLNPFKYGFFAIELLSHKLARWLVPVFMIILLVSNLFMLDQALYVVTFGLQLVFYIAAIFAHLKVMSLHKQIIGKIPLYFCAANLAILVAWIRYISGVRQEIWQPSKRSSSSTR
ncbi:MAG: glycosyltransferase family 2 protein [Gammaproteobacteria bacterium]|nr:glycosyltransferase family 2 protein [Gammaproteobacteria bacterium]MDH5799231.1 glycosyltransferase family 2 protein [Gammaproteobacteria bacterium]